MTTWRTGRTLKVTLYRDEVFVGHVSTSEIAAEIVETMNRVGRLLGEVQPLDPGRRRAAESGRERSPDGSACRFCHHSAEDHARSVGGGLMACARCPLGLCGERP